MNDEIASGEPLDRAVQLLRTPVVVAPGIERRAASRQRHSRTRRITRGLTLLVLIGVVELATRQRASGTTITFSIAAPASRSVSLVGDFTDWRTDQVKLKRGSSGMWSAKVTLPPGRYRFAYLVDHAQWRADSTAASAPDDFGRPTSILTVAGN